MSEWQPIETAPTGHDPVLVVSGGKVDVAHRLSPNWWYSFVHLDPYDGSRQTVIPKPTHWMPLPEPPKP